MRPSHGGSVSGSVSARWKVVVDKKLEKMKNREVRNQELHLWIMQERMGILEFFLNRLYYVRWYFWRYVYDTQAMKLTYRGSIRGRGSREDTHGWVLKHDSVIVKIGSKKWVKAEKGGVEEEMDVGGINVKLVKDSRAPEDWEDPGDGGPGRYSVRFHCVINLGEMPGTRLTVGVPMEELLRPCECHSDIKYYNALSANCWEYANSRAKGVLAWVKENAVDEHVKMEVERKLQELATLERPMPIEILLAPWNPHSEKNEAVLKQFLRKLSGTLAGLPENSWFRRWGVRALKKVVCWRLGCDDTTIGIKASSSSPLEHVLSALLDQDEQDLDIYPKVDHSDSET